MPITINGTGTITGISAGGLPDACITTDDIAANAVTAAKLGADQASGLAKAWVNFNGTGTVGIRASFNVSSITDNGTGDYTVNFATALVDANYSLSMNGHRGDAASGLGMFGVLGTTGNAYTSLTASSSRIATGNTSGTLIDWVTVSVAIFR